jgi:sortase A
MRWLEAGLWTVAALVLGLVAWTLGDALVFQLRADPPASWPAAIADGTPIARLEIPSLDISAVVAEGVSSSVLRRAVGHLPASARPGETGNVALAGHRDTFLRRLEGIRTGDIVELESASGRQRYSIEWTRVVEPGDVEVLADAGYPALTLVTCYPFRYVGSAPQRFVVHGRLVP